MNIRYFWILQIRKILSLENTGLVCVHFRLNSALLLQGFTMKISCEADVCSEKLRPCQICAVYVNIGPSDVQLRCVVCSCSASHCSRSIWQWCGCCSTPGWGLWPEPCHVLFTSLSWTGRDQEELCSSVRQPAVFPSRDSTSVCIAWCKQKCSILMHLRVFK